MVLHALTDPPSALRNVLSTPDTDGDPQNGTPLILLQNAGSYAGGLSQVYVADPDGPGGRPGWIMLTTDGTYYTLRSGDTTLTLPVDERHPWCVEQGTSPQTHGYPGHTPRGSTPNSYTGRLTHA